MWDERRLPDEIDDGAEQLGAEMADDLPGTVTEARSRLPSSAAELLANGDGTSLEMHSLVADTPLEPLVETDEEET